MAEVLLMGLILVVIYVGSDWILRTLERMRGRPFEGYRTIVFFMIFLPLAVIAFEIAQRMTG